nr:desiccation-related protein PCC13-62-like [Ipomoea trifida]
MISVLSLLLFFVLPSLGSTGGSKLPTGDLNLLEFPLNLEYLEAEFFLWGAFGYGLDKLAPNLSSNGPSPVGAKAAKLSLLVKDIITQFGFPRPLLNLSAEAFATVVNDAFGKPLNPAFDPYANDINYLIASYLVPYVGLTGYVGANAKLRSETAKRLVAGLLGVESGQDAVLRTLLYEHAKEEVAPYGITVAEFTNRFSDLRNKLGNKGFIKDEGLIVKESEGAEGKISGNILASDEYSVAYDRSPEEILRIVYGNGEERKPGGFFPKGAHGKIAESYL